jgi:hypothetical protein
MKVTLISHTPDAEIEEFAKRKFPDLKEKGELLKIVDGVRKS